MNLIKNKLLERYFLILLILILIFNPITFKFATREESSPIFSDIQLILIDILLLYLILTLLFSLYSFEIYPRFKFIFSAYYLFGVLAIEKFILSLLFVTLIIVLFIFLKKNTNSADRDNIFFLLLLFFIILIALEIFSRVYLMGFASLNPIYGTSVREFSRSGLVQKSEIPGLGYELIPNNERYFLFKRVKTNSDGLFDHEGEYKNDSEKYVVAVLGDSQTFAFGVDINDSYHSILERTYGLENKKEYDFINFGVGGYSIKDYSIILNSKSEKYRPDHILIGFLPTNDFETVYIQFHSQESEDQLLFKNLDFKND